MKIACVVLIGSLMFSIGAQGGITLTSPNGGETWTAGQNVTVTWSSSDLPSDSLAAVLIRKGANASGAGRIFAGPVSAGQATFAVPNWLGDGSGYTVELWAVAKDTGARIASDQSDSTITIAGSGALTSISLIKPDAATSWLAGTTQNVTWSSTNPPAGSSVIGIVFDGNGTMVQRLNQALITSGSLEWQIKSDIAAGTDYMILLFKGQSQADPSLVPIDTAVFEIYRYILSASVASGQGTLLPASGSYASGEKVTLEATPATGYRVKAWHGTDDDTSVGYTNTVTMNSDKTVTVEFELIPAGKYTLAVDIDGSGTVAPSGGSYDGGEAVSLTATPGQGWYFVRWEGALAGSNATSQVTMDRDKSITAVFAYAKPKVRIGTTMGDIVVELNRQAAPITVENFLRYVTEGFYDGTDGKGATIFHRVIVNFMIQGGGLLADLTDKTTHDPIINEASNGLKNLRGNIAMARTDDPNSATSQFFINTVNNTSLDYVAGGNPGYAVFGSVTEGMAVVDAIGAVKTTTKSGFSDVPVNTITLTSATIEDDECALTINVVGQGNVTPSSGVQQRGSAVPLSATPAGGWAFSSWTGDTSGSNPSTQVTMDGNKKVTATFTQIPPNQHALTVNTSGQGSVTLDPAGGVYNEGTTVTLTANPASGWEFSGWSGALTGSTNPTTVAMDADKSVTATFTEIPLPPGGGGGCFIATAAYGSYFEPHVRVLRDFRDRRLLTNAPGTLFVKTYYRWSPPIAAVIAQHESLRWIVRVSLTPLVYAIEYPVSAASVVFGVVLLVLRRRRLALLLRRMRVG